jgi:hypothetical protein
MKSLILIIVLTVTGIMNFAETSVKAKQGMKKHFVTPVDINLTLAEYRVKHLRTLGE